MIPAGAADLHVHTTHSDCSCTPGDVVRAAASVGLAALAITDHDTITALPPARAEARRLGVELIAGVELSSEHDGQEIHLLGYFVRDDDPELGSALADLRAARLSRLEQMAARLTALGCRVDLDALRRAHPRACLGRRHLADYLARTRQVSDRREAFDLYLRDGAPAAVPKPLIPWDRALKLLRGAGGVAALAHPPHARTSSRLRELAAGGLAAVEVDGPGIGRPRSEQLRRLADALGLVPVGGSDFHAPDAPGRWVGAITTNADALERLRSRAGAHLEDVR